MQGLTSTVKDLVKELQNRDLAAEGEVGIEMTAKGERSRALVKFKPKESIVVKVLNLVGVTPLLNLIRDGVKGIFSGPD